MAVSDAKRKIHAKRLVYFSLLVFLVVGIAAMYNGVGHLYRYLWWRSTFDGAYTDAGMWTEENLRTNVVLGSFFLVTGILGIIGFILLFFKVIGAVNEDKKPLVKMLALPLAIIGLIPSPGLVIAGLMLLFVYLMYARNDFDLFGLLLEDAPRGRPRPAFGPEPMAAGAGAGADSRAAYATGYTEQQSIYASDYAQAAYGGGAAAYGDVAAQAQPQPQAPTDLTSAPLCSSCGKPTEWIEEYQRYYCYDCDRYV